MKQYLGSSRVVDPGLELRNRGMDTTCRFSVKQSQDLTSPLITKVDNKM